jgi:hypothetical protein
MQLAFEHVEQHALGLRQVTVVKLVVRASRSAAASLDAASVIVQVVT